MNCLKHVTISLLILFLLGLPGMGQRFLEDDPLVRDDDKLPFPEPGFIQLSPTFDRFENTFGDPVDGPVVKAVNINTLGQVPDSSWFTNRIGKRSLSLEEVVTGGLLEEPDIENTLTVTGAALILVTAGLVVRDQPGNLYYLKFDPVGLPSLATAADNITSKFLFSVGYNVLPTCIVYIDPQKLEIAPTAQVRMLGDKMKPLDREFVDLTLEQCHRGEDGLYRAVAHLLPSGRLLGGFKFYGTRGDDPNDIFPHENRRELRGLRIFSAWLNIVNCRSLNTMDTFIQSDESDPTRGFVLHHLVDFTTSLGSGYDLNERIVPKEPQDGYEYHLWGNHRENLKTAATLGIWERPWMKIKYPYPEYAEIGRIEADHFIPDQWKTDYPNQAFERMQLDDAFWAASLLAEFDDEKIRAVVHEGEFSNRESEDYLTRTLIGRRDKLLDHYFRQLSPLDRFEVRDDHLVFENLGLKHGIESECSYQYRWFTFDNDQEQLTPLQDWRYTGLTTITVPQDGAEYTMVRIRTRSDEIDQWFQSVDVYLRRGTEVVGIEREIDGNDPEVQSAP